MSNAHDSLAGIFELFPRLERLDGHLRSKLNSASVIQAPAGTFLFGVGDPCNSFLLLLAGTVRVYIGSDEGREMSLYRIDPGTTCLLTTSCLMGNNTYPAIGRAETDIRGVAINDKLFNELLVQSPEFRQLVFDDFGNRLSIVIQLTQEVAFRKLDLRLAQFLLMNDLSKVTHQEIALELGTVREIVSRLLKQFQDEGYVKLHRNRIELANRAALQDRSDQVAVPRK